MANSSVAYCYSADYCTACDTFEKEKYRASVVHSLVNAYGLLSRVHLIRPPLASAAAISKFHSSAYVDYLFKHASSTSFGQDDDALEFGLDYDCPLTPGVADYVRRVCGASISAAECLCAPHERVSDGAPVRIAVNFGGGWHHAGVSRASGFCYANDCCIALLKLRERFARVLYVDLDAHHGDAVQDAFYRTDKVFTLSFHNYEPGFFPGTGDVGETGAGRGAGFAANVPFKEGLDDEQFQIVAYPVLDEVIRRFSPSAICVQTGADCLLGDPIGAFNLTSSSIVGAVKRLVATDLPLLVLGGGGYSRVTTAKCWTRVLAEACLGEGALAEAIPEHTYFPLYGPDFELKSVETSYAVPNRNTRVGLERTLATVMANVAGLQLTEV